MNLCVWWCLLLAAAGATAALSRSRSTFDVQSTLLLNELAGKERDVGYRLNGSLTLEPVAVDHDQQRLLLRFRLQDVALLLRGARADAQYVRRGSLWDARGRGRGEEFYALLERGRLRAFLDARDPPDVLNYKRALLSLFQFQLEDGEYKETDISGECDVSYETLSPTVFRKIKRRCAFEAEAQAAGAVRARRVSRYTRGAGARGGELLALHAEEVVWLALGAEAGGAEAEGAGVKARSWHALALRGAEAAAPREGEPALSAALAALPPALADTPLPLPPPPPDQRPDDLDDDDDDDDDGDEESLESAVETHGAALDGWEAGGGGSLRQAAALAPLLRALRGASGAQLSALLGRAAPGRLPGLLRALGLAGSAAAWRAARALLAPAARDALEPLALHYLAGFALALQPQEETVAEILTLGEQAKLPAIADAALLAGAAAAARCGESAQLAARDRLARGLARAREPAARALRLRALGNLRRADAARALLAAAERGARDAEAALGALRAAPPAALGAAQLERAARLAADAALPLPARALALELAAERLCAPEQRDAVPLALVRLARALLAERGAAAHELRRALWQRLESLRARDAVRALRRVMPPDLASWDARAHAGTSSVLRRALSWAGGGWRAALHSAQLAARALLLRGRVALAAEPHEPDAPGAELLAVEVWTRGLETIAGGAAPDAESDADADADADAGPAAGLRLSVRGAALPDAPLFSGQAELLAHVWAGTGSAPTPVLRALLPLAAGRARVPLQAGAALQLAGRAGAALALDARAAVSLWQRTARARLELRAAAHARAAAAVRVAWSELRASVALGGAARLRIAPDLDFYDAVALCVRAQLRPHALRRTVRLRSASGARRLRVRRGRSALLRRAGASLALGRENDAACRAHAAPDPDDDDDDDDDQEEEE